MVPKETQRPSGSRSEDGKHRGVDRHGDERDATGEAGDRIAAPETSANAIERGV